MLRQFCAIALFICLQWPLPSRAADFAEHYVPTKPPRAMPPFVFVDEKGHTYSLAGFRGEYVLLNLWATWCLPCVKEMPSLNILQQSFNIKSFTVVALNVEQDGQTAAPNFYRLHAIKSLPVYLDSSGHTPVLLGAAALPTSILLNPQGEEIGRVTGPVDWSAPDAVTFVAKTIGTKRAR